MNKKNPKNIISISFGVDVALLQKAKQRCEELGLRSFSEYVKQLIRYDLGLPNYICSFIQKGDKAAAEKLISQLPPSEQKRNS